jgi:hypothetical protein
MSELTRTVGLVATSAAVGALAGFLLGTRVNVGSRLRLPLRRVGENLLQNPSFEQGDTSGNAQTPLDGGATNIRHWPVVGAPGTQKIAYSFEEHTGFEAADGFRFIDLTNSGFSKGPYGGVEQTVALIPGADYELTLQIGGMLPRSGSQVKARAGIVPMGPSKEFTVQMKSDGTKTWGPCTLEFVAPGASSKVRIDAPTPQTNSQGQPSKLIAIDDVQLYRLSPFLRP